MNKKTMIMIVLLSVFCIGYVLFFYFITGANHSSEGYIVVSELGGYYCKGRTCSYKKIQDMHLENKNIEIYKNNQYKNIYQLEYVNHWNFYLNGKWDNFYGDFTGFDSSLEKNIYNYHYEDITSADKEWILKTLQISDYKALNNPYVLVVDLDGNGEEDRIFEVSNQTEEERVGPYFTSFFILLNGKIISVIQETSNDIYHLPFYKVRGIFTMNGEKNPRIILEKYYFDQVGDDSILMYQLNGKKVDLIVEEPSL